MNASQAQLLTETARRVDMSEVYRTIKAAAQKGDDSVTINIEGWKDFRRSSVISTLKSSGYTVERINDCDQREGTSWDNLFISW